MSELPPRIDTPDLGEPLSMDIPDPTANTSVGPIERDEPISVALEGNKPSLSSPLKTSTLASDFDSTSPKSTSSLVPPTSASAAEGSSSAAPSQASTSQTAGAPAEGVLQNIAGAAMTAPAAALEYLTGKGTEASSSTSSAPLTDSLPSSEQTSKLANTASQTAQNLASQASSYAQQAVSSLPAGISAYIPESMKSGASDTTAEKGAGEGITQQPTEKVSTVGGSGSDITKAHTTGNFEASGSLQSTQNPSLVDAQSDLAARAEAGDL